MVERFGLWSRVRQRQVYLQQNFLFFVTHLLYNRLQVVLAKIQQSLPQLKRSGTQVLGSLCDSLLYDDSCTSRAGGILSQAEFIPRLSKSLQESPSEVIADFEEIRKYSTLFAISSNDVQNRYIYNSHGSFGHQVFGHWKYSKLA